MQHPHPSVRFVSAHALSTLVLALSLCTHHVAWAQDPPPTERADFAGAKGLRSDLERIVTIEESLGWFVDQTAIKSMHPTVMQSVCRSTSSARNITIESLKNESAQLGRAQDIYARSGNKLTAEVNRALHVERMLLSLQNAVDTASSDCPFWAPPQFAFNGRQSDRNKFTLSLETGGMLQLRSTMGDWTYGGGGVIRFLPGYGFGNSVTLLGGAEFAGGAMLKPNTKPQEFVVNYFPAVPFVIRLHDGIWHYDFETAAVSLFQADDSRFSFGVRGAFTVGVSALRTRSFLPWAGLGVAYEHFFDGARPSANFLRAGLRIGIMWPP